MALVVYLPEPFLVKLTACGKMLVVKKRASERPLFIFEMANNHQGDLKHGLRIIREFHKVSQGFPFFDFAFKLQARDIPTFIHPDYQDRTDIKYVKRFSETKLSEDDFKALKKEIKRLGFTAICTPFDENSVDLIERLGFDIIKVGSCSSTDWSLLERIAKTDKPVIVSVAGTPLKDIDKVVSFFTHRKKDLTLMHCVGEYPTPAEHLQLNQIDLFKQRYPNIKIGYSTHEAPWNFESVKVAVGKGATVFEKHVGLRTNQVELNHYSVTPIQAKEWLSSAQRAFEMSGVKGKRTKFGKKELADLRKFKRGVFANQRLNAHDKLAGDKLFFAWPNEFDQLVANDLSKYADYYLKHGVAKNEAIMVNDVTKTNRREKVYQIIKQMRRRLKKAKIHLPDQLDLQVSHHYGIDNFYQTGAVIINCVNRQYCKKLIVLFPGQFHPSHFHKKKEETFQVLHGDLTIDFGNGGETYGAGEIILVKPGTKHAFSSKTGAIFEEVSTTHFKDDSFYEDKKIMANKERKTKLTYWLNLD